jgi:hypothetical protein
MLCGLDSSLLCCAGVCRKMLDSKVADIYSCSEGGYAGAITAALFLQVGPAWPAAPAARPAGGLGWAGLGWGIPGEGGRSSPSGMRCCSLPAAFFPAISDAVAHCWTPSFALQINTYAQHHNTPFRPRPRPACRSL